MTHVRLWLCPDCGLKYWPDKEWITKECGNCGVKCQMIIEEEALRRMFK